jgi:site-specific DNA recombinase
MLSSLKARRAEKADSENKRILILQREVTDAEDRLKRLYCLVEDGVTDLDDLLKERLDRLKADRDRGRAALEPTKTRQGADIRIDPALIESFGRTMRENLTTGSTPFRKAYLRSLIHVIEVDDAQVRIKAARKCWKERLWPAGPGPNRVRR